MIYSSVDAQDAEKAFGRYSAFSILGSFIAAVFSTFIITISMSLTALLTVISYGLAAVLSLFLMEVVEAGRIDKKNHFFRSIRNCFNDKRMILFVVSIGVFSEISHTITIFLNQPQYVKCGIDLKYLGIILAGVQLLSMLSAYSYRLTDIYGQNVVLKGLLITIIFGCFVLAFTNGLILSIIIIGVIALSSSLYKPITLDIQNKSINTSNRATILSVYAMIMDVTASVVFFSLSSVSNISIEFSFKVCGIMACASFIIISFLGGDFYIKVG